MGNLVTQTLFEIRLMRYSISNWQEKKQKLLDLFDNSDMQLEEKQNCLSDYYTSSYRPKYFDEWYNILLDDFNELIPNLNLPCASKESWSLWTQIYRKGDSFTVHNHGYGKLSAILYFDFDHAKHTTTTFYCPFNNLINGSVEKNVISNIQEGDIIFFPSALAHECQVQTSDEFRRIMSFNIPME